MKRVNALSLLAVTALLVVAPLTPALAGSVDATPGVPQLAGSGTFDLATGASTWQANPAPLAAVDIYNNVFNAAIAGIASTDVSSTWGDQVTTTGTGILDEAAFTILNAAGGTILTAQVAIRFYDGATSAFLGGFNANVNYGPGGLVPGSYGITTVTGASFLGIDLNTTNILVTQQIVASTGTPATLGVVLMNPPPAVGVGSGPMYINSSTVGPEGFYNVNGVSQADPGYRIATLEPTPTQTKTWGSVKGQYR